MDLSVFGVEVTDLAYDARAVTPGALFFCIPGKTADGHDFAAEAVARGAVGLVVERRLDDLDVPQLIVPSVRAAMGPAAADFFGRPSDTLEIAAVTGTNGKTTTAFLLHAILEAAGRRPALLTNIRRVVGGEERPIGLNTPEAIDLQRLLREMLDSGDRSCAMEATSIGGAQGRLAGTRFRVLVFTNLTQDHLDFHGSMEAYFAAKRALFDQADAAVVNVDDEWGRRLAAELPGAISFSGGDDLGAELRLRGRFNRENAAGAVAAARVLGIDPAAVRQGVESVPGVPGRFESVEAGQPFSVIVDYAHTPHSLDNVLRAARELGPGRLTVVFGAGGDRDRDKRPLMGRVAAERADRAIVTTDNPRSEDPQAIAEEVAAGRLEIVVDRRAAIEQALADAGAGDVVVIAGKGADTEMEIGGQFVPFDDRAIAREVLSTR
jgi:UDP-N-acetylmuramoyl-L-alanyl-D-glutamate--2,6-diaminopimelate ligase